VTAADVGVFERIDWNGQRAATGNGVTQVPACLLCGDAEGEAEVFVSPAFSA
jgi:hypothetical protein